jgi:hypothetical protein
MNHIIVLCFVGQGESADTLILVVKTQNVESFYFLSFHTKFGFKSIKLLY